MAKIQEIRTHLAEGRLREAIDLLLQLNSGQTNMIILQSSRLARIRNEQNQGIRMPNEIETTRNQITHALLTIVDNTEKELKQSNGQSSMAVNDRTTLERIIGRNGLVEVDWLATGASKAKSVCRVHVADGFGTGFLVEGWYLFTNNHVISSAVMAQTARIEFGFDNPGQASTFYTLDHTDFLTSEQLDYTKVKIKDRPDVKLSSWGTLTLTESTPSETETLSIIQHPGGRSKMLAFSYDKTKIEKDTLFHSISTEPGSSGSPVFNMKWEVVAIHFGYISSMGSATTAGWEANQAVLISSVMQDLQQQQKGQPPEQQPPEQSGNERSGPLKIALVYNQEDGSIVDHMVTHMYSLLQENVSLFDIHKDSAKLGSSSKDLVKEVEQCDLIFVFISRSLYRESSRDLAIKVEGMVGRKRVLPIKVAAFRSKGTAYADIVGLPRSGSLSGVSNIDSTLVSMVDEISDLVDSMLDVL